MRGNQPFFGRPGSNWWAKLTLAQRFATLTAVLIAGGAIIQGAVMIGVASRIVANLERERVEQRLDKAANQLAARVEEFRKVPQILAGTPPIARIAAISTGEQPQLGESLDEWLRRLGIIFRSILQANPDLTQARFIGVADGGRELVRVNRVGGKIDIVTKDRLQRKGRRPYFEATTKLPAGKIYLSAIDANVENGKLIRPYETTIRAAVPIFAKDGAVFGIIVANAAANSWLRELSELSDLAGTSGRFLAANQAGDYVYRSDGGPLFGSNDGETSAFEHDWPGLRQLFKAGGPASLDVRDGGQFVAGHRVNYNPQNPGDFLVLATDTNASIVFGDTLKLILLSGAIALAMALIGLLAAYFVSRPLKGLMSAARQIASGKLDIASLARSGRGADIGELGEALEIMKEAVESRDASLRKSEAHLKAIVDHSIDGLITIDTKGTILRYNKGCEEIFGYTTAEAIGQNISILMPKPDSDRHDAYLERYARTGEARFIGARREATGKHKDGHPVDLEVAIAEIKVDNEQLFSGSVRDITERKKLDRIKSEFVSTVTHELRTPLTSIMGSLGLLRAGALGKLTDKSKRMINLAYENGTRLVNLINDILDIDKIEAGQLIFKRESASLRTLLNRAVEQNSLYAAEHGVSIVMDDVPNDIVLNTDSDRFQQVMANLLSNAAKFSPFDGHIAITAKMNGENVRVSVIDQGPGIAEEFQSRVFQKFAQGDSSDKRQKGGTGLGLSISKAIVERLGGRIGFKTQVGAGTIFYFDLPATRGTEASDVSHASPDTGHVVHVNRAPVASEALPRVLHIEDDADTCAVLAESLEGVAQITCVHTAEAAREILLTQSFDLIVLDMLLPNENGDSVLRFLLERTEPPPPVLVFSGLEMAIERWPPVARALVKSRTDIVTLRDHVIELLNRKPPTAVLKRSA